MSFVNDNCTLIVVDPKKGETQSVSLPAVFLYKWRYILFIFLLFVSGSLVACIYLYSVNQTQQEEARVLVSKVNYLQSKIPTSQDTLKAANYIEILDAKVGRIFEYLKKRGVKGFNSDAVGGDEVKELRLSPKDYYTIYDQYLERIFEGLIHTPTGTPLKAELTSNFGFRRNPFHGRSIEFHGGIDFKGSLGDKVKCTADGMVVHAGPNGAYGNCVIVKHQHGYETLYGHLSKISVRNGEKISAGGVVGEVGSTGRSSGHHLHYEVRRDGKSVNPKEFITLE